MRREAWPHPGPPPPLDLPDPVYYNPRGLKCDVSPSETYHHSSRTEYNSLALP
jgi:hypothetical protein